MKSLIAMLVCFLIPSVFGEARGLITHFKKPADWSPPYVYFWNSAPAHRSNSWPGTPMREEGDGWWIFELPKETSVNIVFSDGKAKQTHNLTIFRSETWFQDGEFWEFNPDKFRYFTYPGGATKSLALSFDDGNIADRRLIKLLKRYNLRGTFHLNSGVIARRQSEHIHAEHVAETYAGHEISGHSVNHRDLTQLDPNELAAEVLSDQKYLSHISGMPVVGFAYPYGTYNDYVIRLLKESKILYARTTGQTHNFDLPSNLRRWHGSGYQSEGRNLVHRYLNFESSSISNLMIWGHSWDMGGSDESGNNWRACESFLSQVGHNPAIWSATMSQIAQYLRAIGKARVTALDSAHVQIENLSDSSLWVKDPLGAVELRPRSKMLLRKPL